MFRCLQRQLQQLKLTISHRLIRLLYTRKLKRTLKKLYQIYLQQYLQQVLRAKNEGCEVSGYFIWTLTDNFEWAEGYNPRFGIIHVDFETQQRVVKASGRWYADFLK